MGLDVELMLREPNATNSATATTLCQNGWEASYLEIVLGAGWRDFETERDAAKERDRDDENLFLSAVQKLAVKRIR